MHAVRYAIFPVCCPIPDGMVLLSALIAQPCHGWLPLSDAHGITPPKSFFLTYVRHFVSKGRSPGHTDFDLIIVCKDIISAKIRLKPRNLAELWGKNFAKIKEMYNLMAVLQEYSFFFR